MSDRLVIGSRGSQLALWQANWARDSLLSYRPDLKIDIAVIKTRGDRLAQAPLNEIGGKEVWTKELEESLFDNQIDLAVHSLKDLPTQLPEGLTLGAISLREDVRDVLVSRNDLSLRNLKKGAAIGTSSLRRQSHLLNFRKDFEIKAIRGNVDTRLGKLESEGLDAVALSGAGMMRLGFLDRVSEFLSPERMLPAPGQGALGIEIREGDARVQDLVSKLEDPVTRSAVTAEREMLRILGGGCRVPIGGWSRMESGQLVLDGMVGMPDGTRILRARAVGVVEDPRELGGRLAKQLIGKGAKEILDTLS